MPVPGVLLSAGLVAGAIYLCNWINSSWGFKGLLSYILATAMAGVGLGTSLRAIRGLGPKPFRVGILAATSVGAVSIVLVLLLGPLVGA